MNKNNRNYFLKIFIISHIFEYAQLKLQRASFIWYIGGLITQ